jgi:hypothetical protein
LGNPYPLKQNAGKSFIGSYVLGMGFVVTTEQAQALIDKDPRNKDVLFPYLNGEDLNNNPEQKPSRWVINFFDWSEEKARSYPDCFEIVERLVKPERQRWQKDKEGNDIVGTYALRKPLPQKWWIYGEKRPALYETISKVDQVMAMNRHSKHMIISIVDKGIVYSEATIVFALKGYSEFAFLSSSIHDIWAWKNSSTMGVSTLRYSASNAFETFPFPSLNDTKLDLIGYSLFNLRKKIMSERQIGLTEFYNQFNNPIVDLVQFREIHCEIDKFVLSAYGWNDIQLKHDFYEVDYLPENDRVRFTIHINARKEILKRLLLLNHKQHTEEQIINSITQKTKQRKLNNQSLLFPELT